jgi:hypothetical protein
MLNILNELCQLMISSKKELNEDNDKKTESISSDQSNEEKVDKYTIKGLKYYLRNYQTKDGKNGGDIISSALQYRVFKVALHRLALMHSENVIGYTQRAIEAYFEMVDDDKETSSDSKIYLNLPSKSDVFNDYMASIKTATMLDDDDGMCFTLANKINEELSKVSQAKDS